MAPRRTMPFIYQGKRNNLCGAACLAMILEYFNMPHDLDMIWSKIAIMRSIPSLEKYCCLSGMQSYVIENGLLCSTISLTNLEKGLSICDETGAQAILLTHLSEKSLFGHFVTYSCTDKMYCYVNDPANKDGANKRIKKSDLYLLMRVTSQEPEVKNSNTLMLISQPEHKLNIRQIECPHCGGKSFVYDDFTEVSAKAFLCHHKDRWITLD